MNLEMMRRGTLLDRAANTLGLPFGSEAEDRQAQQQERTARVRAHVNGEIAMAEPEPDFKFSKDMAAALHSLDSVASEHMQTVRQGSKTIVLTADVPRPWKLPKSLEATAISRLTEVEHNILQLELGIRSNDLPTRREALGGLTHLLTIGDSLHRQLAHAVIEQNAEVLMDSDHLEQHSIEILAILAVVDRSLQAHLEDICLASIAEKKLSPKAVQDVIASLFNQYSSWDEADFAQQIVDEMVTAYQFDFEDLKEIWWGTQSLGESESTLYPKKMAKMYEIEQGDPGSTRRLHDQFGISVFDRYPTSVLQEQDEQRDNTDLPYGVLFVARSDHGGLGASVMTGADAMIEDLVAQLRGHFHLRIVEVEGKLSLAKRHLQLDQQYGGKHKIAFSINLAHGQPDSMTYKKGSAIGKLTAADLGGSAADAVLSTYVPKAPHVLVSCLTGAEAGIGQTLSGRTDGTVTAPSKSIHVPKITVTYDAEGRPDFTVTANLPVMQRFEGGTLAA